MSKIALDGNALMEAFYNTPKDRRTWARAWYLFNHAKLVGQCKDCIHHGSFLPWCKIFDKRMNDDDYCSRFERK